MAKKNKSKNPAAATEDTEVEETTEEVTEDEEVEEAPSLPRVDETVKYAEVRGDNYYEHNAVVSKTRTKTIDLDVMNQMGRVEFSRTKVLPFDTATKTGWWIPKAQ